MTPTATPPTGPSSGSATPATVLFGDFEQEFASTRRMLERFPDGKRDWRPHEKSRTLGELATHVADLPNRGTTVLETDEMTVGERPPLAPLGSATELVAFFDANAARARAAVGAADFASLERPWTIHRGAQVLATQPKRIMLRTLMMSHLVHHRAQLGVYYRLLGVPVPGVYGPSADEGPRL